MSEHQLNECTTENFAARGHSLADQLLSPDGLQPMCQFSVAPCCGSKGLCSSLDLGTRTGSAMATVSPLQGPVISLLHLLDAAPNQATAPLPCLGFLPALLLLLLLPLLFLSGAVFRPHPCPAAPAAPMEVKVWSCALFWSVRVVSMSPSSPREALRDARRVFMYLWCSQKEQPL